MYEVISKEPSKEIYKEVGCERCGWTYRYIPLRDAIPMWQTDISGCTERWWCIVCLNDNCTDPNFGNKRTRIEVPNPR